MDGCPLGLGLVVEDKPTEFSYIHIYTYIHIPYIARIAVPFMWGSLRLAPNIVYHLCSYIPLPMATCNSYCVHRWRKTVGVGGGGH